MKLLCTVRIKGTQETSARAETDQGRKIPPQDITALIKTTGNQEKKSEFGVSKDSEILLQWPQEVSSVLQDNVEVVVIPATKREMHQADVVIVVGNLAKGIGVEMKNLACEKARLNIIVVYDEADISVEKTDIIEETRQDVKEFAQDVFFIDLKRFRESKKIQECGELASLIECLKLRSSTDSKLVGAEEELKKSTNDLKSIAGKILENLFLIRNFLLEKKQQKETEKSECLTDESNTPVVCAEILRLLDDVLLGEEIDSVDEPCQCCLECCSCERKKWKLSVEDKMVELEGSRKNDLFHWIWQILSPCAEISVEKEENIIVMQWYCDKVTNLFKEKFAEYIDKSATTSDSLRAHLRDLSATDGDFLRIEPSDFNNLSALNYSTVHDVHFFGRNAKFTVPAGILVFFPAYLLLEVFFANMILAIFGGVMGLGVSFLVRKRRRISCKRVQRMNAFLRKVSKDRLEKKLLDVLRYNEGRRHRITQHLKNAETDLSELNEIINEMENFLRN